MWTKTSVEPPLSWRFRILKVMSVTAAQGLMILSSLQGGKWAPQEEACLYPYAPLVVNDVTQLAHVHRIRLRTIGLLASLLPKAPPFKTASPALHHNSIRVKMRVFAWDIKAYIAY